MALHYLGRRHALDLDALLDIVGGDPELFREVAALGASDILRLVDALDGAESALAMADLAHELKGVLLNLTATPAAKWALAIEEAARRGDAGGAREQLSGGRAMIGEVTGTLESVAYASQRVAS